MRWEGVVNALNFHCLLTLVQEQLLKLLNDSLLQLTP